MNRQLFGPLARSSDFNLLTLCSCLPSPSIPPSRVSNFPFVHSNLGKFPPEKSKTSRARIFRTVSQPDACSERAVVRIRTVNFTSANSSHVKSPVEEKVTSSRLALLLCFDVRPANKHCRYVTQRVALYNFAKNRLVRKSRACNFAFFFPRRGDFSNSFMRNFQISIGQMNRS